MKSDVGNQGTLAQHHTAQFFPWMSNAHAVSFNFLQSCTCMQFSANIFTKTAVTCLNKVTLYTKNLGFKISRPTKTLPVTVYSMVKCTDNLMSHIHIFKLLLKIMFFQCIFSNSAFIV